MKQPTGCKSAIWFWTGVSLLALSALVWLLIITIIINEHDGAGVFVGVLLTFIPIGIGVYSVWRGGIPKAVRETSRGPVPAGEKPETLSQPEEPIITAHKAEKFNSLVGLDWLQTRRCIR